MQPWAASTSPRRGRPSIRAISASSRRKSFAHSIFKCWAAQRPSESEAETSFQRKINKHSKPNDPPWTPAKRRSSLQNRGQHGKVSQQPQTPLRHPASVRLTRVKLDHLVAIRRRRNTVPNPSEPKANRRRTPIESQDEGVRQVEAKPTAGVRGGTHLNQNPAPLSGFPSEGKPSQGRGKLRLPQIRAASGSVKARSANKRLRRTGGRTDYPCPLFSHRSKRPQFALANPQTRIAAGFPNQKSYPQKRPKVKVIHNWPLFQTDLRLL